MANWAMFQLTHSKECMELTFKWNTIQPLMTDKNEPRETKRKILCGMVDSLSDKTFNLEPIVEKIITVINMKEDVCKEYPDSESQVNGILEWLPRFIKYKDKLFYEVNRNRKQYGLKV